MNEAPRDGGNRPGPGLQREESMEAETTVAELALVSWLMTSNMASWFYRDAVTDRAQTLRNVYDAFSPEFLN